MTEGINMLWIRLRLFSAEAARLGLNLALWSKTYFWPRTETLFGVSLCRALRKWRRQKTTRKPPGQSKSNHASILTCSMAFIFARIWLESTISCHLSFKDYNIHRSLFVRVKIQFTCVQMFNSQFGIIGWTECLWLESTWSLKLTYNSADYGATTGVIYNRKV